MALSFIPKTNIPFPQCVKQILSERAIYNEPQPQILEAATWLENQGLITTKHQQFLKCVSPHDLLDRRDLLDPQCEGIAFIEADYSEESDDPLRCEICERFILPDTHKKQRFDSLSITLKPEGIEAYIEGLIKGVGGYFKKINPGIYDLAVHQDLVSICLLDFCRDSHYLALEYLGIRLTLFLYVNLYKGQRLLKETPFEGPKDS